MKNDQYSSINSRLWKLTASVRSGRLYAVLDGSRNEEITPQLVDSELKHCCLLSGNIPEALAEAAPYLVRMKRDSSFMDVLTEEGWGDNWGIYCVSTADFKTLLGHFRDCIKAQTEDGETLFFRFFDPRVLRVYLPTCYEEELSALFGPVKSFLVEGEDPTTVLRYSQKGIGLSSETFALE